MEKLLPESSLPLAQGLPARVVMDVLGRRSRSRWTCTSHVMPMARHRSGAGPAWLTEPGCCQHCCQMAYRRRRVRPRALNKG